MKTNRKKILLAASLGLGALISAQSSHAAYSLNAAGGTGLTAAQLVDILIPNLSGITPNLATASFSSVNNAVHNGVGSQVGSNANDWETSAIGEFTGSGPANGLPFSGGVILTTGNIGGRGGFYEPGVTGSLPPNNSPRTSRDWFRPGSTLLNTVAGVTSRDASFLSFEFSAQSSAFSFQFVFASDEYGTGIGEDSQNFNDAFAFVLTDLTNNSQQNLAVLPFTSTPITVQNVNQLNNPAYFSNNPFGGPSPYIDPLEYDGLAGAVGALPLFATANIVPNRNYRIDIVIGDTVDGFGDSAVFLAADSFVSEPPPNPVPEPATYVGALGLAALIARRMRRK